MDLGRCGRKGKEKELEGYDIKSSDSVLDSCWTCTQHVKVEVGKSVNGELCCFESIPTYEN